MKIYETPDIPNVVAVNVSVFCRQCEHEIKGNAFWSIRRSAQLHVNGGCGNRGWLLNDILEGLAV